MNFYVKNDDENIDLDDTGEADVILYAPHQSF
jgi:hypothetical protein